MSSSPKEFKKYLSDKIWYWWYYTSCRSELASAYNYVCNLVFRKYHLVDTKLPRGHWHDTDTRLLHAAFELLVDFVEVECAHMYKISFPDESVKGLSQGDIGKTYLLYESTSEIPEEQQHLEQCMLYNKEVAALYDWWKTRDQRVNPYDIIDPKECWAEITRQDEEDTEMFVRLVKIRGCLWT